MAEDSGRSSETKFRSALIKAPAAIDPTQRFVVASLYNVLEAIKPSHISVLIKHGSNRAAEAEKNWAFAPEEFRSLKYPGIYEMA